MDASPLSRLMNPRSIAVFGASESGQSVGAQVFGNLIALQQHNVKLVLSGHGHVRERIELVGITHIQSGAVCGMWWKGPVFGDAEAFGVVTCHRDSFDYRFQDFDWNAKG